MQRLIEHILKLKYWRATPHHLRVHGNAREEVERERCEKGWMQEVTNFRNRIKRILKKNPSLKNYLSAEYPDIYQDAIATMSFDFEIPQDKLIEIEQIMNGDYYG